MPSASQQQRLEVGSAGRREGDHDDFIGLLPAGVYPTPFRALEQGGALLLVHRKKELSQKIPPVQDRLFRVLAQHGLPEDAPGSVTVFVVWGGRTTQRCLVVYDHMGRSEPVLLSHEEYRGRIAGWFSANRRR